MRPIAINVEDAANAVDKIRMVFVFGMHPRELITTEAALRLIRTLGITSCASFAGRLATSILQHATIDASLLCRS